ncbi:hypothetical protein DPMN_176436 [Dreissena polymorpha]|uniref:Uncharacterized protein n=1 Tax=Dreissena polymorpha TaxID=45954 RepID=A0A9D4II31_DREPO|nr:hypothetical protein DPMN_176436 [Dreissena polymorpha]
MDNQKLLQHVAVLAGQQALLDGHVALLLVRRRRRRRNRRQSRSCWVRTLLSAKRRLQFGHYDRLMAEIRMEDQPIQQHTGEVSGCPFYIEMEVKWK